MPDPARNAVLFALGRVALIAVAVAAVVAFGVSGLWIAVPAAFGLLLLTLLGPGGLLD